MSDRRASRAASPPAGAGRLRWLRSLSHQREYRPRRAYFRPADPLTLDAKMVDLIESVVTARFVRAAHAGTPHAGERLYRIVSRGASRQLRPERDFDFLE